MTIDQIIQNSKGPVRLHLGCGARYIEGYINIDYPQDMHSIIKPVADVFGDLTSLNCPRDSIDEIRLHHVFEHFNRGTALGLLIGWNYWLKVGGLLHISTPDAEESAKVICSNRPLKDRMIAVRHLMGLHEASWAYHLEQWFEERFIHTLSMLNYSNISIKKVDRDGTIFDIEVKCTKNSNGRLSNLFVNAESLLWESATGEIELPMVKVWKRDVQNQVEKMLWLS